MGRTGDLARRSVRVAWVGALLLVAGGASGFEALEGRFQVHGYYEQQIRALGRDLSPADGIDLAQWYHVLNVEIDYDIAPEGWGPFFLVSLYARLEARYDCVWTRACGLLRSANTFGDRAERLPGRLSDARERGFMGALEAGDRRHLLGQRRDRLEFGFKDTKVSNRHAPGTLANFDLLSDAFAIAGPDTFLETFDDPAPYVFERFDDYRFAARRTVGPTHGIGIQMLGPWLPKNEIRSIGALRDRANPLRGPIDAFRTPRPDGGDAHPVIVFPDNFTDPGGTLLEGQHLLPASGLVNPPDGLLPAGSVAITDVEKPFRPAPDCHFQDDACPRDEARGLFVPNPAVARLIRAGTLDGFDQNFRQAELAWNRGASQQDEKELKELYLDLELFDGRLWLRAGKQNIVWGKTELFRTTDQFNPQDFALATLPDLEESRIALWALRGVWSFYEVGPLSDTRLEVAANVDQFEPVDIGRCGEPFAVNLVCLKSLGLLAHGLAGVGLAGELRPENPWNDTEGFEVGARLEFRWNRFSVQLSDFYGFGDFPVLERIFTYERNVDPETGMPRRAGGRGPCRPVDLDADGFPDRTDPDCLQPGGDALRNHPANQSLFAVACAASIGFNLLEPSSCGVSVLNSRQLSRVNINEDLDPNTPPIYVQFAPVTNAVSVITAGTGLGRASLGQFLNLNIPTMIAAGYVDITGDGILNLQDLPLVTLNPDVADNRPEVVDVGGVDPGLDGVLTSEQEALLGCGPFFEIPDQRNTGLLGCHKNGIDLLNTEASAMVQSWPGFDGTSGTAFDFFAMGAAGIPVPGTVGFEGGPVCTRYENGRVVVLPGCRGPGDPGYDPAVDGTPPNGPPTLPIDVVRHPFACTNPGSPTTSRDWTTCQLWKSEMAAFSWNLLVALVATSGVGEDPALPENQGRIDFFDETDPYSDRRCSFVQMHLCANVQLLWSALGARRATLRAGGTRRFGRRDFPWHQGGSAVLRYEKRNVLGFALDWAEDVTASNWSVEATWIEGIPFIDNDAFDQQTKADTINLTVSVDRPTFVNFLNANRTFFFNSQWFFQYIQGYEPGFTVNGPVNVLGTFTILTGYFQDRLLPQVTFVYDVESASGGVLSRLTYRFSDTFSATVGVNGFFGRFESVRAPVEDIAPGVNRVGGGRKHDFAENGLSLVRDRDEAFIQIRYTF